MTISRITDSQNRPPHVQEQDNDTGLSQHEDSTAIPEPLKVFENHLFNNLQPVIREDVRR